MVDLFMRTGEMAGYQAGTFNNTNNPKATIQSKMAEGQDFATKDAAATQSLDKYTTSANDGLMAYTNTAHLNVKDYLSTDGYNVDEFNKVGSARERPPGVPDALRVDGVGFDRAGR
jgi:hypothetical protein